VDDTLVIKKHVQKNGANKECNAENAVEYGITSFWGRNIKKKTIKVLRLRIARWMGLRVTGS
jgi:hypothetical protein